VETVRAGHRPLYPVRARKLRNLRACRVLGLSRPGPEPAGAAGDPTIRSDSAAGRATDPARMPVPSRLPRTRRRAIATSSHRATAEGPTSNNNPTARTPAPRLRRAVALVRRRHRSWEAIATAPTEYWSCLDALLPPGCPGSLAEAQEGADAAACPPNGQFCYYPHRTCTCFTPDGGPQWSCVVPDADCPTTRPRLGTACDLPSSVKSLWMPCVASGCFPQRFGKIASNGSRVTRTGDAQIRSEVGVDLSGHLAKEGSCRTASGTRHARTGGRLEA
jgi:hypothetical protein